MRTRARATPRRGRVRWRRLIAATATLLAVIYLSISAFVASALLVPARAPIEKTPAVLGLPFESVEITSRDGTRLAGWFVAAETTERAIVIIHGKDSNRTGTPQFELLGDLHAAGYALLTIDLRAHGESGGRYMTMGAQERWDALAAVEWLHERGFAHIGALGVSLGGASLAEASTLTDHLDALVLDSVFPDATTLVTRRLNEVGTLNWFLPGGKVVMWGLTRSRLGSVRPAIRAGQSRVPLLVIYGTKDGFVPLEEQDDYALANPDATVWIADGAYHTGVYSAYHDEYLRRVTDFFATHLGTAP